MPVLRRIVRNVALGLSGVVRLPGVEDGSPGNPSDANINAGNGRLGIAAMINQGMVSKMICSFPPFVGYQSVCE